MKYPKDIQDMMEEIRVLKKEKNALILAHNYQIPSIQDVADVVGDSLELSRQAAKTNHDLIIFCGVHFMAESAAIFSPEKTVLIPDPEAGCSLAASIDVQELRKWKKQYPEAVVVAYVNTTAEVKAESDYCCTSTNAVQIVQAIPENRQVLFLPDMFLGDFVAKTTGRKNMIVYPGECHVHARVRPEDITKMRDDHPAADFLIHPECGCISSCMHLLARGDIPKERTHILSTGGMMKHVANSSSDEYVIATETGMLHPLKKKYPTKSFFPLRDDMVCQFMKMITIPKLLRSLKESVYEVNVPRDIAEKARIPIERMFEITGS